MSSTVAGKDEPQLQDNRFLRFGTEVPEFPSRLSSKSCDVTRKRQFRTVAAQIERFGSFATLSIWVPFLIIRRAAVNLDSCFGRNTTVEQKAMPDAVRLFAVENRRVEKISGDIARTILFDAARAIGHRDRK